MNAIVQSIGLIRKEVPAYVEIHPDGHRELFVDGYPLMGLAELGSELDVKVQNIQHVPGVPEPVGRVRATRLWLGSEVKAFAEWRQERKAVHGR